MTNLKAKYTYEMDPQELEEYVKKEEDKVISKFEEYLAPCEGVEPVLAKLKEENKYFFAVVSSSALRRVKASIIKVGQDKYFDLDHIYSAASSLDKPTSKPDPAIYIHALRVIGKDASDCVAIEDSKSGVGSATNAKIKTIGYVGPYEPEKRAEMGQKLKEAGACIIMNDWSEFPKCIEAIEAGKA
jgi:HAD superfamily hydrolase (TIGR01509 family)